MNALGVGLEVDKPVNAASSALDVGVGVGGASKSISRYTTSTSTSASASVTLCGVLGLCDARNARGPRPESTISSVAQGLKRY